MTPPPVVVIGHRKRGDFAAALGIGQAVAERIGAPVQVANITLRLNALRYLAGPLLGRTRAHGVRPSALIAAMMRDADGAPWPEAASAVVSTLGGGELPGLFVAARTGAPILHLGTVKRAPMAAFDAVFAHQGHDPLPGELELPLVPTPIRLADYAPADAPGRDGMLLVLGGSLKQRPYSEAFWARITTDAAQMARSRGRTLRITTAPRTGAKAEAIVAEAARAASIPEDHVTLFGAQSAPARLTDMLHTAADVIVTADSTSMLSDALASGACVIAAGEGGPPALPRAAAFLAGLETAGHVRAWEVGGPLPDFDGLHPVDTCWSEALWRAVRPLFPQAVSR